MSCVPREGRVYLQGQCPQVVKGKVLCGPLFCDVTPPDLASDVLPLGCPPLLHTPGLPQPRFSPRGSPTPSPAWGQRSVMGPQRLLKGRSLRASTLLIPQELPTSGMGPQFPSDLPLTREEPVHWSGVQNSQRDPKTSTEGFLLTPCGARNPDPFAPAPHPPFSSSVSGPAFLRQCSSWAVAVFRIQPPGC